MWFWLSLSSAIAWGIDHVLSEEILKKISVPTLLFSQSLFMTIITGLIAFLTYLKKDWIIISNDPHLQKLIIGSVLAVIAGGLLISFALIKSNATITSVIEITYPLFVILFSWIFFKKFHLTPSIALGGLFIITGISIIYLFNKQG